MNALRWFSGFTERNTSKKDRLSLTQRLCYSVGHVLNDLAGNAWFSYLLVFLTKVAGLSNASAGFVLLLSQVFEGVCTPVAGVFCDKTKCKYGRRKSWHFIGTACVTTSFPFIFNRCLGCAESSNAVKFLYYTGFSMLFGFGWGCTQIGHLSLIPEISKRESERVELSAFRSALTFLCGIYVYGVTWILLGQSKEETLSPNVWKQFMYLGFIVVGTGTLFNIIFHVGTREPPSEALLERQKKNVQGTSEKKALLKVDCDPSPSTRRSSQRVTTSVCGKSETASSSSCSDELTSIESTLVEKQAETPGQYDIIDRSASKGGQRTWKDWLKDPAFYKTGLVYTCSRLVVNVSQSYLPLYLTETLKFEKEAIAYFPLVVLISGVFASGTVKPLNKRLGSKITFSLGCMLALSACFWFYVQDIKGKNIIYVTAVIMGCGGSVMLVTSLSLIAELIGHDKKSGAFVYGTISFTDKLSSGVTIAIIQEMNPRTDMTAVCPSCDEFVRNVQSFAPGLAALVALISIMLFFDSVFVCKRKVEKVDMAVQTNDGSCEEGSSCEIAQFYEEVEKEKECEKSLKLDHDFEKNSSSVRDVYGFPRAMNNYAASRLASPQLPSPLLDRRTVL
ncbi:major facilitator superfamily domain-containing protein 12-like isoform X2 [Pocillopora damicornis]|uniref:major facilitator superfamily domain-containing protein 12-like isoform X2 n=1 Tax=Pocillopora damicornis TaxID=46731 RepID=UPI000F55083D|nr:major facilitator superfamily domain-containing protein 12-like isoform X2 [Pocillopora damicornis]